MEEREGTSIKACHARSPHFKGQTRHGKVGGYPRIAVKPLQSMWLPIFGSRDEEDPRQQACLE